jgi:hypothetical protein
MAPISAARAPANTLGEAMEKVKAAAIRRGTWNRDPDPVAAPKAAPEEKGSRSTMQKKWSVFRKHHPKVFRTAGTWDVYVYVFFGSEKKPSGLFRWEGYIRQVAEALGRSYTQTRVHFRWLEKEKVFNRWNTGKKFPANIARGEGPAYAFTVVTVMPSPKALQRLQIASAIDARKKKSRSSRAKTH